MAPFIVTWKLRSLSILFAFTIYHVVFKFVRGPTLAEQLALREGSVTERPLSASMDSISRPISTEVNVTLPLSASGSSKPLCSREQIQNGEWHKVTRDKPPYVPPPDPKLMCGPMEMYQQNSFETHEWRPHDTTCDFMPWDRDHFCKLMRQQTILFMGDSLTQEGMYAFGELLGLRTLPNEAKYNFAGACNGTVYAINRREDFLRPFKVAWELQARSPTVAVLNRGAHYVNDAVLMRDMNELLTHVRDWQSNCTIMGRRCLLIWRTTVPGHPNCPRYSSPTTNRTAMEHMIATDSLSLRYNWDKIKRQNELIEQLLVDSGVDFEVLDAYHINIYRPDRHRAHIPDCLHSCLDSKLDVYSQVILHLLRKLRAGAPIEIEAPFKPTTSSSLRNSRRV